MGLSSGARLGAYEIQAALGAGGMGEVYRARDTKLGRDVALKILPDLFASDPERLARFAREARVLASLNHPHIASIYGIDNLRTTLNPSADNLQRRYDVTSDGQHFVVLMGAGFGTAEITLIENWAATVR